MMILIDGHNLIGKLPGIRLSDEEDELSLIQLLQVYCRVKQRDVNVFFDGAAPGFARRQRHGRVTAVFVERGTPADDLIIQHLIQAGKKARNLSVVTSDHRIQAQARAVQAKVIPSEMFVDELLEARRNTFDQSSSGQSSLSSAEVDEWLRLFQEAASKKKKKS